METAAGVDAVEQALRRSAVYRWLSVAFRPPHEGFAAAAADPETQAAVLTAARLAGGRVQEAVERALCALAAVDAEALAEEYDRVFTHQIGRDCPLYEAEYAAGGIFQQVQCAADVAGFYRAFGLEAGESAHERPDHLSLELEFMHVLTYREAYARTHHGSAEVDQLVDAQQSFLRDHLARWAPTLCRLVARRTEGPYRAIASVLALWIETEATAVSAGPVEVADLTRSSDRPALEEGSPLCGSGRCPLDHPDDLLREFPRIPEYRP